MKLTTLTFLITTRKVWLAPKLEGFGSGFLNGYGGKVKVEMNESPVAGAIREIGEEGHTIVLPRDLVAITTMDFFKQDQHLFKCHIFLATRFSRDPEASEEMGTPRLYDRNNPPLSKMWKGDAAWFPQVLIGQRIPEGAFVRYNADMTEVEKCHVPARM